MSNFEVQMVETSFSAVKTFIKGFTNVTGDPVYIERAVEGLNPVEKLWNSYFNYMGNDLLAIMLFTLVFHEVGYFGQALVWWVIDRTPAFRKYKIQAEDPPSDAVQWECIKEVLKSHFTIELPLVLFLHPMSEYLGMPIRAAFPSFKEIAIPCAVFFVLEDTYNYWMHRLLHWGPFYRAIHKKHHKYAAPFGFSAQYSSPLEVLAQGWGTILPPLVWAAYTGNMHIITIYVWLFLRMYQVIDAHSGYDFPWGFSHWIPFWGGSAHHDLHHEHFLGNYSSSFIWWDYMMGTTVRVKKAGKDE
ncbi:C-4 sterol methyl oxidase [Rhizina undulata]